VAILLTIASLCYGQCPSVVSCAGCVPSSGCGYCPSIEKCLPGGPSGPNGSVCYGWIYNACPVCSIYTSCTSCTDEPGCGWIASSSSCVSVDTQGMSKFCPCNEYDQCTDCKRAGCVFCENSGACASSTSSTCVSTSATCNCTILTSSGCPVCALQDDICGWCSSSNTCNFYSSQCSGASLTNTCTAAGRKFDGLSFFGGILLSVGVLLIGLMAYYGYMFYKTRNSHSQI